MRTNFQEWLSRMISKMEMLLEKTDLYAQFGQGWTIFCHAGIGWGVGKSTSLYRNAAKICNISTVVHGSSRGKAGFNLYVCQSRPTFSVSDSLRFLSGQIAECGGAFRLCLSIDFTGLSANRKWDATWRFGFFDISQRAGIPKKLLSFTVPFAMFQELETAAPEGCLTTPVWENLAKRL